MHDNQHVRAGDILFKIDPAPFQAAVAEAEAKLGDDRRRMQPTARRRGRNHVPGLIDDIHMHGVATHAAHAADRRLAGAKRSDGGFSGAGCHRHRIAAQCHHRAKPFD